MATQFTGYEYLVVIAYLVLVTGAGLILSRVGSRNVDEYFLGGKNLPWWVLGISFMTSNLDLTGTMMVASFFSMIGLKGFLVEFRGDTALPLALFMIFMAKWHRRSGVMTIAEWMEFRFGRSRGAEIARLVSAVTMMVLVIGMTTFFCVGFGKFLSLYFPFSPTVCSIIFCGFTVIPILFSGLYGVVITDVVQGVLVLLATIAIAVTAFVHVPDPVQLSAAWDKLGVGNMSWENWSSIVPSWTMSFPDAYSTYDMFGVLLMFWTLRIFLEGFGGPLVPYAAQRFFAARDDREASLMTAASLAFFVIRWPLVIGVALLGLGLGANIPSDPEMIFPAVIGSYFSPGVRAVMVSCMIAAAMSTLNSTVNAGAAYLVNDIYGRFINPAAGRRQLVRMSWATTLAIMIASLLLAHSLHSINDIFSWLTMGFFGGTAVPLILRWYWERYNSWGYIVGTVVGVLCAIVQKALWPDASEWQQLGIVSLISLGASVAATYLTAPVDHDTLLTFYRKTRPLGAWTRVRGRLDHFELQDIDREHRRDLWAIFPALAFFFFLFLCPMYVILHDWTWVIGTFAGACFAAVLLYFVWYKPLCQPGPGSALELKQQPILNHV
jgi:Na+/proline symporter